MSNPVPGTDAWYLSEAYSYAASHSGDQSTQLGALLIDPDDGEILVAAANDIPPELEDTPDRRQRPLKYEYTGHAERRVLYAAARKGIKTEGLFMYVTWYACAPCARAIIDTGIRRVIGHHLPQHDHEVWNDQVKIGRSMLTEAGIEHDSLELDLGGTNEVLIQGQVVVV